jgi:hypothetical protein
MLNHVFTRLFVGDAMSTKCTIDHDDKWHLYEDALDETVWVETRGYDFAAGLHAIRIQLPEAVIDAIRKADACRFPHLRTANASLTPAGKDG